MSLAETIYAPRGPNNPWPQDLADKVFAFWGVLPSPKVAPMFGLTVTQVLHIWQRERRRRKLPRMDISERVVSRQTREEIFRLRDTMSAREIAAKFGLTRNQVVGIWHRERVKRGIAPMSRPRFNHAPAKPRAERKIRVPNVRLVPELIPEPVVDPVAAGTTTPRPLTELTARQCRYAVTADSPFLFCGAPSRTGSSYCAFHHQVCWKKAS